MHEGALSISYFNTYRLKLVLYDIYYALCNYISNHLIRKFKLKNIRKRLISIVSSANYNNLYDDIHSFLFIEHAEKKDFKNNLKELFFTKIMKKPKKKEEINDKNKTNNNIVNKEELFNYIDIIIEYFFSNKRSLDDKNNKSNEKLDKIEDSFIFILKFSNLCNQNNIIKLYKYLKQKTPNYKNNLEINSLKLNDFLNFGDYNIYSEYQRILRIYMETRSVAVPRFYIEINKFKYNNIIKEFSEEDHLISCPLLKKFSEESLKEVSENMKILKQQKLKDALRSTDHSSRIDVISRMEYSFNYTTHNMIKTKRKNNLNIIFDEDFSGYLVGEHKISLFQLYNEILKFRKKVNIKIQATVSDQIKEIFKQYNSVSNDNSHYMNENEFEKVLISKDIIELFELDENKINKSKSDYIHLFSDFQESLNQNEKINYIDVFEDDDEGNENKQKLIIQLLMLNKDIIYQLYINVEKIVDEFSKVILNNDDYFTKYDIKKDKYNKLYKKIEEAIGNNLKKINIGYFSDDLNLMNISEENENEDCPTDLKGFVKLIADRISNNNTLYLMIAINISKFNKEERYSKYNVKELMKFMNFILWYFQIMNNDQKESDTIHKSKEFSIDIRSCNITYYSLDMKYIKYLGNSKILYLDATVNIRSLYALFKNIIKCPEHKLYLLNIIIEQQFNLNMYYHKMKITSNNINDLTISQNIKTIVDFVLDKFDENTILTTRKIAKMNNLPTKTIISNCQGQNIWTESQVLFVLGSAFPNLGFIKQKYNLLFQRSDMKKYTIDDYYYDCNLGIGIQAIGRIRGILPFQGTKVLFILNDDNYKDKYFIKDLIQIKKKHITSYDLINNIILRLKEHNIIS